MKRYCHCCNVEGKGTLDELGDKGWSGFQIGRGKVYSFCPNCQGHVADVAQTKLLKSRHVTPPKASDSDHTQLTPSVRTPVAGKGVKWLGDMQGGWCACNHHHIEHDEHGCRATFCGCRTFKPTSAGKGKLPSHMKVGTLGKEVKE